MWGSYICSGPLNQIGVEKLEYNGQKMGQKKCHGNIAIFERVLNSIVVSPFIVVLLLTKKNSSAKVFKKTVFDKSMYHYSIVYDLADFCYWLFTPC